MAKATLGGLLGAYPLGQYPLGQGPLGSFSLLNPVPAAAAYVGPSDITGGNWALYWALRAISKAYCGGPAIDVTRASDSTTKTINTLQSASGVYPQGCLDYPTLNLFLSGTTGTLSKWWDQSGSVNHGTVMNSGSGTVAVTPNALGPFMALTPNGSAYVQSSFGVAQVTTGPCGITNVMAPTSSTSTGWLEWPTSVGGNISTGTVNGTTFGWNAGGSAITVSTLCNNTQQHAFNVNINGASSLVICDGAQTSGTFGSISLSSAVPSIFGEGGGFNNAGPGVEFGIFNGNYASYAALVNNNQHAFLKF